MPTCDRCDKVIQGPKFYSDPIEIDKKIVCRDCYNAGVQSIGRHDLVDHT